MQPDHTSEIREKIWLCMINKIPYAISGIIMQETHTSYINRRIKIKLISIDVK